MMKVSVISNDVRGHERQNLLKNLLDSVKLCQTKFGSRNELATETDHQVSSLCQSLENVFNHGLRSKPQYKAPSALDHVTDIVTQTFKQTQESPCFWHFVRIFLTRHELERYLTLKNVCSDIGRGRAWLRSALNERSLERYLQLLLASSKDGQIFYHDWALLLDQELNSTLPNMAAGLGAILFAISIDEGRFNSPTGTSSSCPISKSEPVLSVPIEEIPHSRRRKKAPAHIVSFDESDTGSLDAVEATIEPTFGMLSTFEDSATLVLSAEEAGQVFCEPQAERPALAIPGNSPSPSSNDSSLHDFDSSIPKQTEVVSTLTPVNDGNVGELMLISTEGLPGDDVSLGPDTDDCLDAILNHRLHAGQVTGQDLEQLYNALESVQDANNGLRAKLKAVAVKNRTEAAASETRLLTLTRENEVLKHQLRKYVSAVQMLNKDGAAHEALAYLEASQMAAAQREEATKYQEQLVQVAQMHGELMEFNERLTRNLVGRDEVIRRLERELTDLRGPLPPGCVGDTEVFLPGGASAPPDALVHIWIPSAFLSGGASGVHHLYQVYVRMRDTEWNIYRRYAQFYALHKQLKQTFPVVATLDFPPKKTIGNKDAKFVEERRQRLQRYLRQAVDAVSRARADLADPAGLISIIPFFSQSPNQDKSKSKTSKSLIKKRGRADPTTAAQYNGL